MSDTPEDTGWFPDPTGRFARRYHDGTSWTDNVADQPGQNLTDPFRAPEYSAPTQESAPSSGSGGKIAAGVAILVIGLAIVGVIVVRSGHSENSSDDEAAAAVEPTTTATTPTTTTTAPMDAIRVEDPETGQIVTFAELVDMRQMVEVQTSYGPVWLDRDEVLADSPLFADGVAYMIDNCANLAAADLLRTEGIDSILLVCLEDGQLEVN